MEIIIWDDKASRIHVTEMNLRRALSALCIKASITIQSEPPLLSRLRLLGTTPILEIAGMHWRCQIGEAISYEQSYNLLEILLKNSTLVKEKNI